MSASLVGSEMCIRDRGRTVRSRQLKETCRILYTDANLHAERSAFGLRQPVSYTHLTLPTICSV
eukprot:6965572-Alexandrium_andersonii.AAC.1